MAGGDAESLPDEDGAEEVQDVGLDGGPVDVAATERAPLCETVRVRPVIFDVIFGIIF